MSSEPLTAEERLAFVNFVRLWWQGPNGLPVVAAGSQEVADEDFEDMERDLASLGLRLAVASEEPRPRSDVDRESIETIRESLEHIIRVAAPGGYGYQTGSAHIATWAREALAALPSPRSDDREGTLREAASIIEDIALCVEDGNDSQPLLDWLPAELSDRIAAFLNRAALHSAPDTVDEPARDG